MNEGTYSPSFLLKKKFHTYHCILHQHLRSGLMDIGGCLYHYPYISAGDLLHQYTVDLAGKFQ